MNFLSSGFLSWSTTCCKWKLRLIQNTTVAMGNEVLCCWPRDSCLLTAPIKLRQTNKWRKNHVLDTSPHGSKRTERKTPEKNIACHHHRPENKCTEKQTSTQRTLVFPLWFLSWQKSTTTQTVPWPTPRV